MSTLSCVGEHVTNLKHSAFVALCLLDVDGVSCGSSGLWISSELSPARSSTMPAFDLTLGMLKVLQEQKATNCNKVDILPFALAAFASWRSMVALPVLFLQQSFPLMSAWARQIVEGITSLIGTVALLDQRTVRKRISEEAKTRFARAHDDLEEEMERFGIHVESKLDRLTSFMKDLIERQLNGVAELFQELGQELGDPALFLVANMAWWTGRLALGYVNGKRLLFPRSSWLHHWRGQQVQRDHEQGGRPWQEEDASRRSTPSGERQELQRAQGQGLQQVVSVSHSWSMAASGYSVVLEPSTVTVVQTFALPESPTQWSIWLGQVGKIGTARGRGVRSWTLCTRPKSTYRTTLCTFDTVSLPSRERPWDYSAVRIWWHWHRHSGFDTVDRRGPVGTGLGNRSGSSWHHIISSTLRQAQGGPHAGARGWFVPFDSKARPAPTMSYCDVGCTSLSRLFVYQPVRGEHQRAGGFQVWEIHPVLWSRGNQHGRVDLHPPMWERSDADSSWNTTRFPWPSCGTCCGGRRWSWAHLEASFLVDQASVECLWQTPGFWSTVEVGVVPEGPSIVYGLAFSGRDPLGLGWICTSGCCCPPWETPSLLDNSGTNCGGPPSTQKVEGQNGSCLTL